MHGFSKRETLGKELFVQTGGFLPRKTVVSSKNRQHDGGDGRKMKSTVLAFDSSTDVKDTECERGEKRERQREERQRKKRERKRRERERERERKRE